MANLNQIKNWFKNQYPTVILDPEWFNSCSTYLQERFPQSTTSQLIKQIETQFLLSDLSTSTLQSPLPSTSYQTSKNSTTNLFGPNRISSHLVQITSLSEIAHPTLALLQILDSKRSYALELSQRETEGIQLRDGEEEKVEEKWLRGMMRVGMSDGFREWEGVEVGRIEGLGLGEIRLGAKLLLNNVKVCKNLLLLDSNCVIIKGHGVEELEELAEFQLENLLRGRLGMPLKTQEGQLLPPPLPPAAPPIAARARPVPAPAARLQQQQAPRQQKIEVKPNLSKSTNEKKEKEKEKERRRKESSSDYFEDEDFDALLAEAEAEAENENKNKNENENQPRQSRGEKFQEMGEGKGKGIARVEKEEEEEGFDSEAEKELLEIEMEMEMELGILGKGEGKGKGKKIVSSVDTGKGKQKRMTSEYGNEAEVEEDLALDGLDYKLLSNPLSHSKKKLKIKSETTTTSQNQIQYLDLSSSPELPTPPQQKQRLTSSASTSSQVGLGNKVKQEIRKGKLVEVLELGDTSESE